MKLKPKSKVYKKGTVVMLHCCTHDLHSEEQEEWTLTEDTTEEEIESVAEQFMWDSKEPEWYFEVIKESEE